MYVSVSMLSIKKKRSSKQCSGVWLSHTIVSIKRAVNTHTPHWRVFVMQSLYSSEPPELFVLL